jgi:hypothetical protein
MMAADYKMKYLEDLKAKTQKKWDALNEKIFANPLGEIIELHKKAIEIINSDRKDYAQIAKELDQMKEKEKKLKKLFDWQQKNSMKAIDEQFELETVIADINHELFYLKIRAGRMEI